MSNSTVNKVTPDAPFGLPPCGPPSLHPIDPAGTLDNVFQ